MRTSSSSQFALVISLVPQRRRISWQDIFGGQTQQPESPRGVDDVNLEVEPMFGFVLNAY
jgi:hypothetical protein